MSGESLKLAWRLRTQRERTIIAAGAVLVAVAALYAFLWHPGMAAIRSLSEQLPRLHAQVEEMQVLRSELAALRGGAVSGRPPASPALLQSMLEADPLVKAAVRIQWRGERRLSLEAPAIDFDRWVDLVTRLQRELGVRVEQCAIAALAQPGMVKMEAVLTLPAEAGPSPR